MKLEDTDSYKNALSIIKDVYNLNFPQEEKYMLQSQMIRASHSILLNICEAYPFRGKKRANYYRIALGSAYETKACCAIYEERMKTSIPILYEKIDRECALITGMIRYSDSASDSVSETK